MATERASIRTRVEGLVILLVAAGYLWETANIPEFYQIPGVPGPATFPDLLGAVFAAAGAWLLLSPQDLLARLRAQRGAATPAHAPAGDGETKPSHLDWHFYAVWAVALAYLCLMPTAGFPLATFVVIFAFMWLLGETRFLVLLGVAFGATAAIYFSFAHLLMVRLPLGWLEPLVKAGLPHA